MSHNSILQLSCSGFKYFSIFDTLVLTCQQTRAPFHVAMAPWALQQPTVCHTYSLRFSGPITSVPSLDLLSRRVDWLPSYSVGVMLGYSTYFGQWLVKRYDINPIPVEVLRIKECCPGQGLSCLECCSVHQKGCRFDPWSGQVQGATNRYFSLT